MTYLLRNDKRAIHTMTMRPKVTSLPSPKRSNDFSSSAMRCSFFGMFPLVQLFLLVLIQQITTVTATISVNSKEFQSMPAIFGAPWKPGVDYYAHLQFLPEHIFLCTNDDIVALQDVMHSRLLPHGGNATISPTNDDLPVALLVSRGGCSFEEKARTAMKFSKVAYVIVFDDHIRPSTRPNLVPMSATDGTEVDVGMIFVSYATGMRKYLICVG